MDNPILNASNNYVSYSSTDLGGRPHKTLHGLPLGVYSGEVALKVAVISGGSGGGGGGGGQVETPSAQVVTTNGTVPAGAEAVSFLTSADFVGTILGAAVGPSNEVDFAANPGNTLAGFTYTVTAGSILIIKQII